MTESEHRLMIEMFKQQMTAYSALVEILKSRGLVQEGDLDAYTEILSRSGKLALIQDHVEAAYQEFAKELEVDTGIGPEAE